MEFRVDRALCQGHSQCEEAAPDVFELRDDGFAHTRLTSSDDPEVIGRVAEAQRRCPVDAIVTSRTAR